MKHSVHLALLAAVAFCATSAFAANKAVVNIPFSFETNGQVFPAGQYTATLDLQRSVLAFNSVTNTALSAHWLAGPADSNPNDEKLTLKFDDLGSRHILRTVQLGPRITSRLDARSLHGEANTATVGGQ